MKIHQDWKPILLEYKDILKDILTEDILEQLQYPPSCFKYTLISNQKYVCPYVLWINNKAWKNIIKTIPIIDEPITIEIYTDGALGSYGIHIPNIVDIYGKMRSNGYILKDDMSILSVPHIEYGITTQRGEYMAMCIALLVITKLDFTLCKIITDSYNTYGLLTLWKDKDKHKNPDLIKIMKTLYSKKKFEIVHTLSHNKDKNSIYNTGNNQADSLAEKGKKKKDIGIVFNWFNMDYSQNFLID